MHTIIYDGPLLEVSECETILHITNLLTLNISTPTPDQGIDLPNPSNRQMATLLTKKKTHSPNAND